MRSPAHYWTQHNPNGQQPLKWLIGSVDRGRHNKRGTYCLASTLTLTPTHQHARRHTRRHARAQREREKQREGGEAGTLHGAVRHHISTHWPPFYLLWSLSVLSFYQLGADGRTAALILETPREPRRRYLDGASLCHTFFLPPLLCPRQPVQRQVPQAPAGPVRPPGGQVRGPDGVLHRPVHPPRLREGILGTRQVRLLASGWRGDAIMGCLYVFQL